MRAYAVVLISLITSVIAAAGTSYAMVRFGWAQPTQPEKLAIPNLVGLPESDAKNNLAASGLTMMVDAREPADKAEPGTVIRQSPPAGWMADPGQSVSLTFAMALPQVPEVVGRDLAEATELIKRAGYEVETGEPVASAEQPKGVVAKQSPPGGTALKAGEKVTLRVSGGPAEVEVPKLLGQGIAQAKTAAEQAGLELKVQWVSLAETTSNVVLRQDPDPGTKAAPGASVTVMVNRGD